MDAERGEGPRWLSAHPSSVGEARRIVRERLLAADRGDLLGDAELLVTEVVTNALVHAGTAMSLRVRVDTTRVRLEVADRNPRLPSLRWYPTLAGTGRGLHLIEHLTSSWGAHPTPDGKVVWCELGTSPATGDAPGPRPEALRDTRPGARDPAAVPGTNPAVGTRVTLRNVPLLLYAAWHQHAEAVLREYLLASLDPDQAEAQIQNHATANEAMSLLYEAVPAPDIGADPEALMATVTDDLVSADALEVQIPAASVPHFEVLDDTLDAALVLAEAGQLLTPAMQPELVELRRWLCVQVLDQARGRPPQPWASPVDAPPPDLPSPEWDGTEVTTSPDAVLAADDTNRILAISIPALTLLGYDDAEELLGRRLVAIIPQRYRQAHLAGFTLHFAHGRSVLLGHAVIVPTLRKDDSEAVVELTVRVRDLPGGRRVFIGQMRPTRSPAHPHAGQANTATSNCHAPAVR